MNILFLPISIDVSSVNFVQFDTSIRLTGYNPYWYSTLITPETVVKNKFDTILNQLPFTKISTLTYKIQQHQVGSHVDVNPKMTLEEGELENIKLHEPSGYRFVLKGKSDSVEVFNGREWVTAHVPNTPCCYLINSTSAFHRVKEDIDRTTIYVRGILDTKKHLDLIDRSYKEYKEYAISKIAQNG